jgi:hypothetical protein
LRRQIIIVTHNANLVVNADADQVIVATCGPHRPGELPEIGYEGGGLENPNIRRQVCEILEGAKPRSGCDRGAFLALRGRVISEQEALGGAIEGVAAFLKKHQVGASGDFHVALDW